jgi:hypothetical protein
MARTSHVEISKSKQFTATTHIIIQQEVKGRVFISLALLCA